MSTEGIAGVELQVIIPAYNERENIAELLRRLDRAAPDRTEVLVVVDDPSDNTISAVDCTLLSRLEATILINKESNGPANAIKYGIRHAAARNVVVMMADGSDDVQTLNNLYLALENGADLVCASRYMRGGRQNGGPVLKGFLSRAAGHSFRLLTGVNTHDVTNCYKGYRRNFIQQVELHSSVGFEIGLETIVRAIQNDAIISEVPTVWSDRTIGRSRFKLAQWLPLYLRWYFQGLVASHRNQMRNRAR